MNAAQGATTKVEAGTQPLDLESLFAAEYPAIARTIARITRDPGSAEELAVEVFLRFSLSPTVDAANAPGWLFRTAVRLALDEVRRQNRRSRLQKFLPCLAAPSNPEEVRGGRDRQARVSKVLSYLKRRDVELLILRAEGMTYEELAHALSIKTVLVGTLLSRAQKAFRKEYVNRYGLPD